MHRNPWTRAHWHHAMVMKIAFIGFGEAAQAFVRGWREAGLAQMPSVAAYDILFGTEEAAARKHAECAELEVRPAPNARAAAAGADLIFSAVTADQAIAAARSAVAGMGAGQLYCDINSAAPFRKAEAAALVEASGARYVDVAVMDPVLPKLHRTPLLLSAAGAAAAAPLLEALGMNFEIVSDRVGDASMLKMIRSVAIKGYESVTMECVVAAVKLGIDARVLPSVAKTLFRHPDFDSLANHVSERVTVHGKRRAAEMREVAATLEHLGLPAFMAQATAAHQQWVTDLGVRDAFAGEVPKDALRIARALLERLEHEEAQMQARRVGTGTP
jgi:3-hydroxyisobutyrate dehydrogenase-like beta-hydroxyacid dehydrogenase